MLKTVSSITNAIGALNFKGTWDANANSPVLTSSVGTKGDYYVVGTAGSTNLNGISNWGVGDLATFNGSVWQRVEGGADLNGVNLSVSGTSTLSGLTASTALALNASKEVVSVTNTGTGNNVLATSPQIATPTVTGDAQLSTGNVVVGTAGKGIVDAGNVDRVSIAAAATVINESGADIDTRIESDTNANMLFVDAGANKIGIGTATTADNAELNINSGLSIAASGLYKPYREFAKSLELDDNTLTTYLTITIPAVANFNDFINVGGEISYAILAGRETSGRGVGTVYGKLYVSISRYFESAATAPVTVAITNTDQALASTGNITPTITWSTTQTAGTDSAAKNVFIEITVDNPASGSVVQAIAGSFKYHSLNRYVGDITVA
jgi:hypothetical protein